MLSRKWRENREKGEASMKRLIRQLTTNLGVTENQARAGAGLIFKFAYDKLSNEDFAEVRDSLYGLNSLMRAAPPPGKISTTIGGVAAAMGSEGEKLADLVSLTQGFSKVDMEATMIHKFVPIIISFAQAEGGERVKNILARVLK
jgi:hypothetical protein